MAFDLFWRNNNEKYDKGREELRDPGPSLDPFNHRDGSIRGKSVYPWIVKIVIELYPFSNYFVRFRAILPNVFIKTSAYVHRS